MHSDPAEVQKAVRKYFTVGAALLVFTAITVAANRLHLAVPVAIAVALIIACMKGSMVAAVFMHLSNEKRWIYGGLILAVIGFIALMSLPFFTISDTIGTPVQAVPAAEHTTTH